MPDVVLEAQPAVTRDLPQIVRIHQQAFPGFTLTDLGGRFLTTMYAGFAEDPDGVLLVVRSDPGAVAGLLAGTRAPDRFFRRLRSRRGAALAIASIAGLARHPLRLGARLMSSVRYRGDRPDALPGYWLLSSLAVDPAKTRSGFAARLVREFCRMAEAQGAPGVYLITDANDNDSVLQFYESQQFGIYARKIRGDGRRLAVLSRDFR